MIFLITVMFLFQSHKASLLKKHQMNNYKYTDFRVMSLLLHFPLI